MNSRNYRQNCGIKLRSSKFEERYALQNLDLTSALQKIDYPVYFETTKIPLPTDAEGIAHYMLEEKILVKQDNGLYAITNLGAILFGKRLLDFDRISRKAIRVVQYGTGYFGAGASLSSFLSIYSK